MTDTYNDTTGSRKKFLIPLVVLLLCAVSLTGAGYAYNSSVTMKENTAPVDETFVIDLYDPASPSSVITQKIDSLDAINGLVFVTEKTLANVNQLTGKFTAEGMDIILYDGLLKVNANNLARGVDDPNADHAATTEASLSAIAADTSARIYKIDGSSTLADLTGVTVKFYSDAGRTLEISKVTVDGTPVYFRVLATGVDTNSIEAVGLDANAFAADVITKYKVEFNFGINAEAIEGTVPATPTYEVDGHAYQLDASTPYTWANVSYGSDNVQCTVLFTCEINDEHTQTEVVSGSDVIFVTTAAATCDAAGLGHFEISGEWNGIAYQASSENVVIPIPTPTP